MGGLDLLRLVVMASVAGVGRIIHRVAGGAIAGRAAGWQAMFQGKGMLVKGGWRPPCRGMAVLAL